MPFLSRNRVKSYKDVELGEVTNPNELTIKYPYDSITPNNLVKFIWLVHERKGLKPELPFGAYVNHIKGLLKEMEGEEIIPLILKAGELSNHPFTVKLLRRIHEQTTNENTTPIESARPRKS